MEYIWLGVNKLPDYNPFMFEVARLSRGQTATYVSTANKIPVKKIRSIENGDIVPDKVVVERLSYWYDFPLTFFTQWWSTRIDFTGCIGRNVPIDYLKYKIFREDNPNFRMIKDVPFKSIGIPAKIIPLK